MLPNTSLDIIISEIKNSSSCFDFCRFSLGLNISHEGQSILAPSFIRSGDSHPSFAVYHDHAFDFTTGRYYDIFELLMLAKGYSFPQAFQELAGYPLSSISPKSSPEHDAYLENLKQLEQDIKAWHNILLDNKSALDYCYSRGLTHDTILKLYLGFDPQKHRLIIPFIRNGKPRYYAARDITGNQKPKYLYPKADIGLSKIPFGLSSLHPQHKRHMSHPFADIDGKDELSCLKSSTLILTEGILDAAILIQDGWQCLASGGGSFGQKNNRLVLDTCRMFDKVCLAYDNDSAGKDFQLKIARWLLGENIPFVCANIPHSFDGHVVKDINDLYCAGGDFFAVLKSADSGISFVGSKLNTIKEVYEFVKSLAGYATAWDLQELYDVLAGRTKGSLFGDPDPEKPETMDASPLFTKGELRSAIKAAGSKVTDKELMRRVLKNHQLIFSTDGKFYEYNHRYWEQKTKETVKRYISQVIGERATESRCGAVMALMKLELEDDTPFNAQHVVTFPNGVLLLDEPDPEKRFVPHSPDFRCTFMEDFMFDAAAKLTAEDHLEGILKQVLVRRGDDYAAKLNRSTWMNFLKTIFPRPCDVGKKLRTPIGDPKLIREVQKMCGYIYFTDNTFEKTFMFLGKGGNGKSTLMQIIEEVVGSEFCTHLRPNRLASSFDPIVLRNSILNICHEASKDLEGAEETLKAVTSGNPIMASYKGQDTISFKPRAKWLISANSPMDVKDVSYAFTRRMIFVPFRAKFAGKDADPTLLDKLRQEKSIIFNWMYEGYLMLKNGEGFQETPEQLAMKDQIQEYVDHTLAFVREYFTEGDYIECLDHLPGSNLPIPMRRLPNDRIMYKWYLKWCKDTNTEPLSRQEALVRINEAIGVKCPQMKIIRTHEVQTGIDRDTYVMPDFGDKLESISIYDEASRNAILDVFAEKEIPPHGEGIQGKDTRVIGSECRGQEGKKITPQDQNEHVTPFVSVSPEEGHAGKELPHSDTSPLSTNPAGAKEDADRDGE